MEAVTVEVVKRLIIDALMLEDLEPGEIVDDDPLFGEGLGLDSIDALELALAIDKKFGVKIAADDQRNREIFRSATSLARHISAHRTR